MNPNNIMKKKYIYESTLMYTPPNKEEKRQRGFLYKRMPAVMD